jgi:osmotically-inducible protein OsmY
MKEILRSAAVLSLFVTLVAGCQWANRTMGSENRSDATVTAAVKERITQDRTANFTDINVDTRDGTVYLRGEVPTMEDKRAAERLAQDVSGVNRVVNDLRVSSTSMSPRSSDMR